MGCCRVGGGSVMKTRTGVVLGALSVAVALLPLVVAPEAAGAAGAVLCGGLPATIWGTEGPNMLHGTSAPDVIAGLGGDDVIYGYDGADLICGGPGNDTIWGGNGTNRMWGDEGDDVISGGPHFDTIYGGPGRDVIDPGLGAMSRLYGNANRDRIILRQLRPGDDHLVSGGAGRRDILDLRFVTLGAPYTGVGANLDTDHLGGIDLQVTVQGQHYSHAMTSWASNSIVRRIESVYGSPGNDILSGNDLRNKLRGLGGDDEIYGWGGDDRLVGGAGSDVLLGMEGDDYLSGGAASDWMAGAEGNDDLYGRKGDDYLEGGPGADHLYGGPGSDICDGESLVSCETIP